MSSNPETTPVAIRVEREAGRLSIDWADGHRTEYSAEELRRLCPCAFCIGEAGAPGWLSTNPTLTPEQTRIVDAGMVGQYALAPVWADGHDTGYYTFELLRVECPCDECTARRAMQR